VFRNLDWVVGVIVRRYLVCLRVCRLRRVRILDRFEAKNWKLCSTPGIQVYILPVDLKRRKGKSGRRIYRYSDLCGMRIQYQYVYYPFNSAFLRSTVLKYYSSDNLRTSTMYSEYDHTGSIYTQNPVLELLRNTVPWGGVHARIFTSKFRSFQVHITSLI
jgi:hypothetical protein